MTDTADPMDASASDQDQQVKTSTGDPAAAVEGDKPATEGEKPAIEDDKSATEGEKPAADKVESPTAADRTETGGSASVTHDDETRDERDPAVEDRDDFANEITVAEVFAEDQAAGGDVDDYVNAFGFRGRENPDSNPHPREVRPDEMICRDCLETG